MIGSEIILQVNLVCFHKDPHKPHRLDTSAVLLSDHITSDVTYTFHFHLRGMTHLKISVFPCCALCCTMFQHVLSIACEGLLL